jgi:hypothetical protein
MKKLITFLLILLAVIAIVIFAVGISNLKINQNYESGDNTNTEKDKTTGEVIKDDAGSEGISGNVVKSNSVGESSSSGSSSGTANNEDNPKAPSRELPSDLNARPCGFYFIDYAVCAGTCPRGQCLIEGKSCYCRIV